EWNRRRGRDASLTQVLLLGDSLVGQIVDARRERHIAAQHLTHPPRLRANADRRRAIHRSRSGPRMDDGHFGAIARHLEERYSVHLEELANARKTTFHVHVDLLLGEADERSGELEKERLELQTAKEGVLRSLLIGEIADDALNPAGLRQLTSDYF